MHKLFVIGAIGILCFLASIPVMGLVNERVQRFEETKAEVASTWGNKQTITGPILVLNELGAEVQKRFVVFPNTLQYKASVKPEERSRGIFSTPVYTSEVSIAGTFSSQDIIPIMAELNKPNADLSVVITDTHGIEQQLDMAWGNDHIKFEPGSEIFTQSGSGLHASIPVSSLQNDISFSLSLELKGSESISFSLMGRETTISLTSPWQSPKFIGPFLPVEHTITNSGFIAEWRITSFGRSYPQTSNIETIDFNKVLESAVGVDLYEQVDLYTQILRSVKYAILFIAVTFLAFFLFETLTKIRIHPIQYLLIGMALALFYLLLLSFAEHIGFLYAYAIATFMTTSLISLYSAKVLAVKKRAFIIFALLIVLYGYLYFVLHQEDYALLFGSSLFFTLLAVVMYLTRNIDWFNSKVKQGN
jgi:inner membrane protein